MSGVGFHTKVLLKYKDRISSSLIGNLVGEVVSIYNGKQFIEREVKKCDDVNNNYKVKIRDIFTHCKKEIIIGGNNFNIDIGSNNFNRSHIRMNTPIDILKSNDILYFQPYYIVEEVEEIKKSLLKEIKFYNIDRTETYYYNGIIMNKEINNDLKIEAQLSNINLNYNIKFRLNNRRVHN
mgnify:CR=1 FL=1|jgi:hypothetical protein